MKKNKMFKRIFALCACVMIMFSMAIPSFAVESSNYASEAVSAMNEGLSGVTSTLTIGNIVTVLLAVLGIAVGFMFFWWAIRKVLGIVQRAFKKGKVSV